MLLRTAVASDYATLVRLFPELRLPDPVPDDAVWERDFVPTTLIAEHEGRAIGLAYYQVLESVGFLRTIITDPTVRRTGAGKALMNAVHRRCRDAGCSEWRLNVFPDNTPAVTLYEAYGFTRAYVSKVVELAWACLDGTSPCADARTIHPEDDPRVERDAKILPGLLPDARAKGGRVLRMIEHDSEVRAAAIFDPAFPGAYPFYARDTDHAVALLHALRQHRKPSHDRLRVVLAEQPHVTADLVSRGGTLLLETMHMRARITLGEDDALT